MKNTAFIILVATLAASCARQVGGKDATIITVPLADEILLGTDTGRIIPLETSDSSLIYDICALEIIDGKLFVNSRNYIRIYDGIDGHFIGNAGRAGSGVGEYLMIGNISADADTLMVFDSNKHEILRYGPSGEYIGSQWPFDGQTAIPGENPRLFFSAPGGGWYSWNSYTDRTTAANPLLSYYSVDGRHARHIAGRDVSEGSFMPDCHTVDAAGRTLIWEPLRDTIFAVDTLSVYPAYAIDFGEYALPSEDQNRRYLSNRLAAFNASSRRIASAVRFVQADGNLLYFSFATNDGEWHLAAYDTDASSAKVYKFASAENNLSQEPFFKVEGDSALLEMRSRTDIESNPCIYKFPLSILR